MRILLSRLGCEVFEAEDGHSGISLAASIRPDVVFIDVGLPDLDGYQVAASIRTILGPSARLVALSGYRKPEDALATQLFDAYLVKPVEPDAIARVTGECSR